MKQFRSLCRTRHPSALAHRGPLFALLIVVVTMTAACSSAPASDTSDWARLYAYPLDDVWSAAEDAADAAGFDVEEADRERGQLRIASVSTVIEMRFEVSGEVVRVDVFVASAGQPGPTNMQRAGDAVQSILNGISRILRERAQ